MRKNDWVFLSCALAGALIFGWAVIHQAYPLLTPATPHVEQDSAAGKPRDVDSSLIRQQIQEQRLSTREADFYSPVPDE